ncbi:DUF4105 domain-containing protein [Marinomonas sp. TI.3.20]|uniref:lipoprotein N-acyltransferase Lnb domain-containing protein n=1 Tax=Marinomonas sp. TI.3.20 TaxID=3121296 RepID=UPI00311DEA33
MTLLMLKAIRLPITVLFFVILSGCSTLHKNNIDAPQVIFSTEDGMPIIAFNTELRLTIDLVAVDRLAKSAKLTQEEWLIEYFSATNRDAFSPDSEFFKLADIVSDNDLKVTKIYIEELARYITQAYFACKQPLYYEYFQQRYAFYKEDFFCDSAVPFDLLSRYSSNNIIYIDPNRVRDIHIVFASKDNNMMSKFGHISLRFVICPEAKSSKAECDANLYQHIVLGYMAHIDDIKINSIKGVLGGYKAYLYANSFMDVYQKYTISEFRDLYSLPLNLDQKEREEMLRALAEIHWGYVGDYKFINRNCSTLMQIALTAISHKFAKEPSLNHLYWRPDHFFQTLKETNISDAAQLEDLQLAESNGYYFPSTEPIYKRAFEVVQEAMVTTSYTSLSDYLIASPIERVNTVKNNHEYMNKLAKNDYLLEAQLLLEELSLIKSESLMNAEMGYFFDEYGVDDIKVHMMKNLDAKAYDVFSDCVLKPMLAVIQPKKRSHGIPTVESFKASAIDDSCQMEVKANSLKQVNAELEALDPEKWASVKLAVYYWLITIENITNYKALRG